MRKLTSEQPPADTPPALREWLSRLVNSINGIVDVTYEDLDGDDLPWHVLPTENFTLETREQAAIHGELDLEGVIVLEGSAQLVLLNPSSGSGSGSGEKGDTGDTGATGATGADGADGATAIDQIKILFVSKAGNDSNSGLNANEPKLTIDSAITDAIALSPASSAQIAINIIDSAEYAEQLTLPEWVHLHAPNASLSGRLTVGDNTITRARRLSNPSNPTQPVVRKEAGTGFAKVEVDLLIASGADQEGFRVNSGVAHIDVGVLSVDAGVGIKAKNGSRVSFIISEVQLLNGGTGIGTRAPGGGANFFSGNILYAKDDGTGVLLEANVDGDTINIQGGSFIVDTLYDLGANTILNAFTNEATGTRTADASATVNVITLSGDSALGGSLALDGSLLVGGTVDGVDIAAEETRLANTSGTNTGDQTIPVSTVDFDPVGTDNSDDNAVNSLYSGLVSNIAHPLVETAVPSGALFTDTVYDDSTLVSAIALNTAKVTDLVHPLVETAVPSGALFTDTIYTLTKAKIETELTGVISSHSHAGGGGSVYSFNRVIGAGTQALTSASVAIVWDASNDSFGSDVTFSGGNPTRLTAVTEGVYVVAGYVTVQSAGQRACAAVEIHINGTPTGLQRGGSYLRNSGTAYDYWTMDVSSTPFTLEAGDYVELGIGRVTGATYGYGGSLAINCERTRSEFWLERVA